MKQCLQSQLVTFRMVGRAVQESREAHWSYAAAHLGSLLTSHLGMQGGTSPWEVGMPLLKRLKSTRTCEGAVG